MRAPGSLQLAVAAQRPVGLCRLVAHRLLGTERLSLLACVGGKPAVASVMTAQGMRILLKLAISAV